MNEYKHGNLYGSGQPNNKKWDKLKALINAKRTSKKKHNKETNAVRKRDRER